MENESKKVIEIIDFRYLWLIQDKILFELSFSFQQNHNLNPSNTNNPTTKPNLIAASFFIKTYHHHLVFSHQTQKEKREMSMSKSTLFYLVALLVC